jgi:hypothetical protein
MELLSLNECLAWLEERGIGCDPRYPKSNSLTIADAMDSWRPWPEPAVAGELFRFVDNLLTLVAPTGPWVVYPHERGRWSYGGADAPEESNVFDIIRRGAGIPLDWIGAARFDVSERAKVVALLVGSLVCGWGVGEDLYCVPDDRSAMLMASHHEEVVGHFRSLEELQRVEDALIALGYDDPDATLE